MAYSRVINNIINTTAQEPYTENTENEFWFEHSDDIKYSPGDIYIRSTIPKPISSWGVTSMDSEPVTFVANTV